MFVTIVTFEEFFQKNLFVFLLQMNRFMENILSKSPLFQGLSHDEIKELLAQITWQTRRFNKDELIAMNGEECSSLMIVIRGSVKGEMIDYSGRVLKIEDILAPRPLAVAFLFGKNNRYPVSISANETTEILIIPKPSVVFLMQNSEVFLTNFLNAVSNRAQFISGKLRFLSFKTLKGKLAHYLMELERRQNIKGEVRLMQTQEELAELFGVARPSLSRTLRDLHHQGLIEARGRTIKILDREGLLEDAL